MPPKLSDGFEDTGFEDTGFEATSFCTFFGMCLMLEEGFEVVMQYFNPKPNRFLVPRGGWGPLHKLCTIKFFGCCKCSLKLLVISCLGLVGL